MVVFDVQATKETALNLAKFIDKEIRVKFSGGREGIISFIPVFFHLPVLYFLDLCSESSFFFF